MGVSARAAAAATGGPRTSGARGVFQAPHDRREDEEGGDDKVDEVEFAALYRQLLAIVQQKDGD
eukprot:COSAG04_NODE_8247_length_1002_cov_1.341085_2_plen_64_part_00